MSADSKKEVVISAEERNRAAIALAEAMGRARDQHAVRDTMRTDARVNTQQRLEMLRLKLTPVFDAVPRDAEQFNLGVVSAEKPRLYIDIIGYVEMTSHLKGYRLMQETRRGVQTLAESNDEAGIITIVTDYIARRLVERERALAGASPATPLRAPVAASSAPDPVAEAALHRMAPDASHTPNNLPAAIAPVGAMVGGAMVGGAMVAGSALASQQTGDMVAHARETLMAAPQVVEEQSRLSSATHAASQAAEHVKERAAGLMETARQALSSKVLSPKGTQTPALSHQDVVSQANPPHVDVAQPVEAITAAVTEPAQSVWRKAAPAVAATALATTGAAISTRSGGGAGSWVWALLSLLIGIGIGALLLYLYALSIARP